MTAVLDLASAYDQVPRNKLFEVIALTRNGETMSIVQYALQPVRAMTEGDQTGETGTIAEGVSQGSPLSTTLFNMYMDTLSKWVAAERSRNAHSIRYLARTWQITLFSDDVELEAKHADVLPELLDAATNWAKRFIMTRNAKGWVDVRFDKHMNAPTLQISGQIIKNYKQATYLGVTVTAEGTDGDATVTRKNCTS